MKTISVKKIYPDVTGEFVSGYVLQEIVKLKIYDHLPGFVGEADEGFFAIDDLFWAERAIKPDEADRALRDLKFMGFIKLKYGEFDGPVRAFVKINESVFFQKMNELKASEGA